MLSYFIVLSVFPIPDSLFCVMPDTFLAILTADSVSAKASC